MTRIPAITERAGLTTEQQSVFDAIVASRGGVRGPWTVLLHRPAIASAAVDLGGYLRYHSGLTPAVRETAILTTVRLLDCEYEWQSHKAQALAAGVDEDTIERIRAKDLEGIPGDVGLAIAFARAVVVEHRVPEALFERARTTWSPGELLDLTGAVGYFSFVAAVLNTFDVLPPA